MTSLSNGTSLLPAGTRVAVLASGKIGHEVNCFGVAAALGVEAERIAVNPRAPFIWLSPWGPADGRDRPREPFPDIVLASGRITVPYLRFIKQRSGRRAFCVFLQDPRGWRSVCDMIWMPEHDEYRGPNVMTTLTSPHPLTPKVLAEARSAPLPAIAALPSPRVAMVLGGDSASHSFTLADRTVLTGIAVELARQGYGVMVTPSRRTPEGLVDAMQESIDQAGLTASALIWDGAGENPYRQMVANADTLVVTGDSVNMVGEAAATGRPVHVYEPSGGNPKITAFLDALASRGAVRRWSGRPESWSSTPIDATAEIARELALRYRATRR